MPHKDKDQRRTSQRKSLLKRKWSLTLDQYNDILKKQKGLCAICKNPETAHGGRALSVDHDHETGKIRGLLCHSCNTGIGHLKDNMATCKRAAHYLKKHGEN